MADEKYRVQWFPPQYAPAMSTVPLRFFTPPNGFTAEDASAVAELDVGAETCFDNWHVRVLRLG